MRGDEASREGPGARDRDLLTEQRSHGQLEAVPRAGDAHARALSHARREPAIAREVRVDGRDVDVEVEEAAKARDDRRQPRDVARVDRGEQAGYSLARLHLDDASRRTDGEGPLVALALDALDARHRARGQELDHRAPVVGRAERKLEANARGGGVCAEVVLRSAVGGRP